VQKLLCKILFLLDLSKKMSQKGSISIYLSIMLLSVLLLISSGISILMLNQIKMSSQTGHSTVSYYAAESGIERCLYDMRKGSGTCNYSNEALDNSATYDTTWNAGGYPINSTGYYLETNRAIEVN